MCTFFRCIYVLFCFLNALLYCHNFCIFFSDYNCGSTSPSAKILRPLVRADLFVLNTGLPRFIRGAEYEDSCNRMDEKEVPCIQSSIKGNRLDALAPNWHHLVGSLPAKCLLHLLYMMIWLEMHTHSYWYIWRAWFFYDVHRVSLGKCLFCYLARVLILLAGGWGFSNLMAGVWV